MICSPCQQRFLEGPSRQTNPVQSNSLLQLSVCLHDIIAKYKMLHGCNNKTRWYKIRLHIIVIRPKLERRGKLWKTVNS